MAEEHHWQTWSPDGAPFPFSMAIAGEGWSFITEAGHDDATGEIPESATEQARLAIAKVAHRLEQQGLSLDDVVHVRPYVTEPEYAAEFDAVMAESFTAPLPVAGPLIICRLIDPRLKIEFEVTARKGARRV